MLTASTSIFKEVFWPAAAAIFLQQAGQSLPLASSAARCVIGR